MRIKRRRFFKLSGLLGASCLAFPSILRAESRGEAKLRIALVGAGGRGRAHVKGLQSEHFAAFCDVDDERAAETYREFPDVPRFKDFRRMFDKMGKHFDAVSISVPDHMHYPVALWAIAHGKHVFCEKPLVRTFEEAMRLKRAALESGVITQMGNQGHASDGLREIEEWIDAGLIGKVSEVYHWTNRPIWPQGMSAWPAPEAVPASLDWDLWQGVAPLRPFSSRIVPFKWRGYRDYGSGAIGDIACHAMDASYTPLKLGFPSKISSESVGATKLAFPRASTLQFEFPGSEARGPVRMTWMDGGRRPENVDFVPNEFILRNAETNKKGQANGSLLVGSKGTIHTDMYASRVRIFPNDYYRELREGAALPPTRLARVGAGHFMEWVNGVKNGIQPGGNIADYAADFTGTALLGAAALFSREPLVFDQKNLEFVGNDRANALLRSGYPYREEFLIH